MLRAGVCLKIWALLAGVILIPQVGLAQQGMYGGGPWQPGKAQPPDLRGVTPGERQRLLRQGAFMNKELPERYLNATNEVGYTTKAIADGGPLYLAQCSRCHGPNGLGNGELAMDLTPSPALLAFLVQQPIAIDQYLLWSISEGGVPFGTAMPAFKDILTEDQIWSVVAYLRAGFPKVVGEDSEPESEPPSPVQSAFPEPNGKP